jgi:hypothetical protein
MTNDQLKKEFEKFVTVQSSAIAKPKENDASNDTGQEVKNYALKYANKILQSLGDIEIEAAESISVAQEIIWKKLLAGDISVEGELNKPNAYWMSHFTQHICYYLLKHFARRSSRNPGEQYKKEVADNNDSKQNLRVLAAVDSKHLTTNSRTYTL